MKKIAYIAIGIILIGAAALIWSRHNRNNDVLHIPTFSEFKKSSGGESTISAEEFLSQLKKLGDLPGFDKDAHGTLRYLNGLEGNTYPISRTFHLAKDNDSSDYHYTVVCESKGSPWRLKKAWRTDSKGETVETYLTN